MDITEFLHDPLVLSVFSAVLPVLVGLFLYAREHPRKSLAYRVLYSRRVRSHAITTRLNSITRALPLRNKVRAGVYEIEVKVRNTGRSHLRPSDFGLPVTIKFGRYASVLSAAISKANPAYLSASCSHDGKTVTIEAALLNRGDWVRAIMLVQDPSYVRVVAHVADAPRLSSMDDAVGIGSLKPAFLGLLLTMTGSTGYSLFGPDPNNAITSGRGVLSLTELSPSLFAIILSLLGGYLLMFAGTSAAAALMFTMWSWARNRVPVR